MLCFRITWRDVPALLTDWALDLALGLVGEPEPDPCECPLCRDW